MFISSFIGTKLRSDISIIIDNGKVDKLIIFPEINPAELNLPFLSSKDNVRLIDIDKLNM